MGAVPIGPILPLPEGELVSVSIDSTETSRQPDEPAYKPLEGREPLPSEREA